ncbi:conserved Plasmodium protein, unknown function [Plasmodium knowlesi strain H]|uniref:Uncharacterized protein n=3 Tax=Plasmodium knowlesi TaxID=5850 RepID=A0A5K1VAL3_PLAKH|nr:conserved Plasmodium protein, unknown function [Plasmodium knowlesi strain H]OTN68453.1 Uncharacterized protein PKNOH_S02309000 [Plasmodium knowlesi]CAA9986591.1 conserved Plasmodium protein, unknown function [Plasmodium knowlesi strain H]SBO24135.1 conserved Plasmodium protein, unknown function [Plasmodium knowlesi strain H]SBO29303.1 conserved Plasmodium protein, unknown function [Plasmodium knowlesi strain H]VVS76065.1 conserved Plasmodium protein, unknown function [Plasmodium knowlesi s|eukprot:XP_002261132.1 hypothetical protein, conserved in Plasmodium species [Plasmodium knowlesi strain H]
MHFFFAANNPHPPSASLEHVQDDHVTLRVCLDDVQTHSGDVFRASFELVGPKKYAGNVKLDYVVVYLYGVYILNQEILTACTNGPLSNKHENINLPFYGPNEKDEQKFLLFYSNPIVICTDVNFGTPSETTHYHLSCILPPFLPPTYNGKFIKYKYSMYVQVVKRLYRNRTEFVTKRYEHHLPLRLLSGRCIRSPVLDLVLLPIKPSICHQDGDSIHENGEDPLDYLYHDFRAEVIDEVVTQGDNTSPARSNKNFSTNRGILERGPLSSPSIPLHLYNHFGKTTLDRLLCIYLLSSQRKEDSSLFHLNYVLPNYNYFYYMHMFLYVAHHCDYYSRELSLSGEFHQLGCLRAFFSLLRSFSGYSIGGTSVDIIPDEPNKEKDTQTEGKTNPVEEELSSSMSFLQNDDNHMHDTYLSNYPDFFFNEVKYVPLRWYDNLVLHQQSNFPIEATDEEDFANLYLEDISSESSSELEEEVDIGKQPCPDGWHSSQEMTNQRVDEASYKGDKNIVTLPEHGKGFLLDKVYTAVDTIIKCMEEGDMFKRINTRKIKPQSLSPHVASHPTDGVVASPVKDSPNGQTTNKDASQNIYRINANGKNICLITLMDGMDNQVTDTFPCGGIINVQLYFGDATIFTVHVDVRLKRIEQVKIDPTILTLQRNNIHDEIVIPDETRTSMDSEGKSHHCISSCKLINERNVSTLHCSIKNVNFVLGEGVVPSFSNDTVSVDYLLDFDFFCHGKEGGTNMGERMELPYHTNQMVHQTNKGYKVNGANEEKGSVQGGESNEWNKAETQGRIHSDSLHLNEFLDDNIYSLTFRIPIHIIEPAHNVCPHDVCPQDVCPQDVCPQDVCAYDTGSNTNPTGHAKQVSTSEGGPTSHLLLQNSHKFMYADMRHFVRTLKM